MTDQEKMCAVFLEKITLKKTEHNAFQDIIEDYKDLGNLGRIDKQANTVLFFAIRGIP